MTGGKIAVNYYCKYCLILRSCVPIPFKQIKMRQQLHKLGESI